MKTTAILLLLSLTILIAISCNKRSQSTVTGNYLIIGHDGGFVNINAPYYLITKSGLTEDSTHYAYGQVPATLSGMHFTYRLPAARFDTVKDLLTSIPEELFSKNNADIGGYCPDYGYEDVRASIDGVLYQWKFECDQSASSAEVQAFLGRIYADF